MGFQPDDLHLWDPWFFRGPNRERYAQYLQAPKALLPDERHDNASIGQAVFRGGHWVQLEDALLPGEPGVWDDLALWTGSVLDLPAALRGAHGDSRYALLYTGRSQASRMVQRVGLALSDTGVMWRRYGQNPVLDAGGAYSTVFEQNSIGVMGAWRDPFAFVADGRVYAAISAKTGKDGPYNACIGLATTEDMVHWELLPPLLAPGRFAEMEVPEIVFHGGKCFLHFTCAERFRLGFAGPTDDPTVTLYCYVSENGIAGPFRPIGGDGAIYSSELHRGLRTITDTIDARRYALGWQDFDSKSKTFVGGIGPLFKIDYSRGAKVTKL